MSRNPAIPGHPTSRGSRPRRFSADRMLGVLLMLLQVGVLAYLSGARGFPLIAGGLIVWGAFTRTRLDLEPIPRNLLYAVMAIGFLTQYTVSPYELPLDSQFIRSGLAHSLARLLISVQVVQLYLHHANGRLPIWIAACGGVALCFAANVRVPEPVHESLRWVVAVFVAAFAVYGSRARTVVPLPGASPSLRKSVLATVLLGAILLGTGASMALQKHDRAIEAFLSEYIGYAGRTSRAGFTPNGRLQAVSDWKVDGADRVMLRVFADAAPGYLRGMVFDTYQGAVRDTSYTAWVSTTSRRPLPETNERRQFPQLRPGDRLFEVNSSAGRPLYVLDVWPAEGTEARIFSPLETLQLAINASDVRINGHGVLTVDDRIDSLPYMIFAGTPKHGAGSRHLPVRAPAAGQLLTSLDGPVGPEVRELARNVCAGCRTTRDKVDAVQRYFLSNYQYGLGINVPRRMDPMTYFLTQRPPAHCEYFATGTAMLLRLADVPCRYVVGYVVREYNGIGGFWIARNKDAHAWVEAFDEAANRWIIVESTPATGVPQPRELSLAAQMSDAFLHQASSWRIALREYGASALWLTVVRVVWSIPGLIVLLVVLGALLAMHRPLKHMAWTPTRKPAHLKVMHQMLVRLDRLARRQGLQRRADETLTQFAGRLQQSSDESASKEALCRCYALYVRFRYGGETGQEAVQSLRQAISAIPKPVLPTSE